jgi:pimeloyl-ACP methyl ester carboxylesterase
MLSIETQCCVNVFFQWVKKCVFSFLIAVVLLCANTITFAQGSGSNALNFRDNDTFNSYIERSVDYIKTRHVGTPEEKKYSYPFFVPPKESCDQYTGFLLLHGLAVNPSNMRDISESIQKRYDGCVLIFAPIMAGHGTTLEDVVNMRYQDWVSSTENAYRYLKKFSPHKTVVMGYSTGGTLTLNLLGDLDVSDYPDAMVLFAPGTQYKNWLNVYLARILQFFQ